MSTSNVNVTQSQGRNVSIVDCTYPMGSKNEKVSATVITINLLFASEAFIELAYLLWSSWKDRIFVCDFEFCCVYLLRKRKRIRKVINKIRENVSDEVFYLYDDFGGAALSLRKLDEIYINVIIQEGLESTSTCKSQFKNRHESYDTHLKKPESAYRLSKTSNLFKPIGISNTLPKTILVVGRPGIGKTLLTKKLLHEWKIEASKFWRDKIIILIQFRDFNDGKTSLPKMLEHAYGLNLSRASINIIFEYICLIPNNAIFIFDGLDELKYDKNSFVAETSLNDPNQEADILQIFRKMVNGQLLPGVTVLATSRPTAGHIYDPLPFDKTVEILGFDEEQIKSYVEKFCQNDKDKKCTRLWNLIKQSPEYLSLSYVPVNCYIICLTLKEAIDADEQEEVLQESFQSNVPRTITELYKRAIKVLLFRHHNKHKVKGIPEAKDYMIAKLPEHFQNDLDYLKKTARKGMLENNLVFKFESDDKRVELKDCGLINDVEDKRGNPFSFLHLTIQEFLAAQHVVDDIEKVEAFLTDHIDDPKWHLVIQFVAGLIGDKIKELEIERTASER